AGGPRRAPAGGLPLRVRPGQPRPHRLSTPAAVAGRPGLHGVRRRRAAPRPTTAPSLRVTIGPPNIGPPNIGAQPRRSPHAPTDPVPAAPQAGRGRGLAGRPGGRRGRRRGGPEAAGPGGLFSPP